jgi:hypothetical protein
VSRHIQGLNANPTQSGTRLRELRKLSTDFGGVIFLLAQTIHYEKYGIDFTQNSGSRLQVMADLVTK